MIFFDILAPTPWTEGHLCPLGGVKDGTFFSRVKDLALEEAKSRCSSGCKARDDCMFANLYYTASYTTCYLRGTGCGNWETNTHGSYHLYKKGISSYQRIESSTSSLSNNFVCPTSI